jgi:hypothetical protein
LADARGVEILLSTGSKRYADVGPLSIPWMCLACCLPDKGRPASLPTHAVRVASKLISRAKTCVKDRVQGRSKQVLDFEDHEWEPPSGPPLLSCGLAPCGFS